MSKVLQPGWHNYGMLSIYVDDDGFCYRGELYSRGTYSTVFPCRLFSDGLYHPVSFKAYSGSHCKYFWKG